MTIVAAMTTFNRASVGARRCLERGETVSGWTVVGWTAFGLTIVAGVVLRFTAASPLWLDEALSVHIAAGDLSLSDALRRDGHPGLYYLLLSTWIDLAGDSDFAVRALSGLFGVLSLPFGWLAAQRFGRNTAVATTALLASSPYAIRYSTETRMYALVVLLVAIGWWATQNAWDKPSPGRLILVAGAAAGLVHTHYWTLYLLTAVSLLLIAVIRRSNAEHRRSALRVLAAIIAGSATFVIWLPVFLGQLAHTGTPWAKRARPTEIFIETVQGIGGNNRFEGETLGILLIVAALLGVFTLGPARDGILSLGLSVFGPLRPLVAITVGTLGLGATAAILTAGAFEARYAGVVVPFLLLLAGRGIAVLTPRPRVAVLGLLVVLGLAINIDEARRTRSQSQEVAMAVNARVEDSDLVLFCPDQVGPATTHYLNSRIETAAYPSGTGTTVDWRDYLARVRSTDPAAFATEISERAAGGAVWFISGVGYREIDSNCGAVNSHLGNLREGEPIVGLQEVFEGMYAIRYTPR